MIPSVETTPTRSPRGGLDRLGLIEFMVVERDLRRPEDADG
jgi:hypothetical protein